MTTTTLSPFQQNRFSELMRQTHKKVYNLAYRLSMNRQDAEDLTQEAFLRAYRSFGDYQGDRPFENWIFRIVTRLFLDLNRSRRRRVQTVSYDAPKRLDQSEDALLIETADQNPNAETILINASVSEDLEKALNSLKPDHRTLVILADVEQMPYNEIATMMGLPVGTVRSRLHRAHRRLREALERSAAERAAAERCADRRAIKPRLCALTG